FGDTCGVGMFEGGGADAEGNYVAETAPRAEHRGSFDIGSRTYDDRGASSQQQREERREGRRRAPLAHHVAMPGDDYWRVEPAREAGESSHRVGKMQMYQVGPRAAHRARHQRYD